MPLTEQQRTRLAGIVAQHVPHNLLADVIGEDSVITNFDEMLRLALDHGPQKDFRVALDVLHRYEAVSLTESLLGRLGARLRSDDFFVEAMYAFRNTNVPPDQLEGAIVKRARWLRWQALRGFLDEHEPRICVIATVAAQNGHTELSRGTGFLVSEDLVITARHVLKYHIDAAGQAQAGPGELFAFFDHLDGRSISDPRDPNIRARRVAFHQNWLVALSEVMANDGRIPDPLTELQIARLLKSLDVVLIRLAEPIGAYSRWRGGGARRGWVTLPKPEVPAGVQKSDRIFIPQHPHGEPQQVDFGRCEGVDDSKTRVRYDTETDKGTSGAPCFNQHFQLVGMHNACYEPPGIGDPLNQAIRFDHILEVISERIVQPPVREATPLWSVAEDESKAGAIIGRRQFLDWIEAARSDNLPLREQRVYVAHSSRPRSGSTFSLRILRAAVRGKADRIVAMGTVQQALPKTAFDLISILFDQLKIPATELANMPKRADSSVPRDVADGDKPNLWLSRDVPIWLNDVLRRYRAEVIDRVAEAKADVARLEALGIEPDVDLAELANLNGSRTETKTRWQRVWISLDDLQRSVLEQEVRELLAALVGTRSEETAFHEELKRLRWLFLGAMPDFLDKATVETLDQMALTDDDISDCLHALAMALDAPEPARFVPTALLMIEFRCDAREIRPHYDDPATRLPLLQKILAELREFFLARLGRKPQ